MAAYHVKKALKQNLQNCSHQRGQSIANWAWLPLGPLIWCMQGVGEYANFRREWRREPAYREPQGIESSLDSASHFSKLQQRQIDLRSAALPRILPATGLDKLGMVLSEDQP
jgi:hypothetical protein